MKYKVKKKRKLPNICSTFHHNYVTDEWINVSCYCRNMKDPLLSLKNLLEEHHNELLVRKDYPDELLLRIGTIYIVRKCIEDII